MGVLRLMMGSGIHWALQSKRLVVLEQRPCTPMVLKGVVRDITNSKSLTTTEPLKIGYRNQDNGGTNLDFFAADLQYFNVALDVATIQANIALKDITKHPNNKNLVGYWQIDDGTALTLYWLRVPTKSEWGLDGVGWIL